MAHIKQKKPKFEILLFVAMLFFGLISSLAPLTFLAKSWDGQLDLIGIFVGLFATLLLLWFTERAKRLKEDSMSSHININVTTRLKEVLRKYFDFHTIHSDDFNYLDIPKKFFESYLSWDRIIYAEKNEYIEYWEKLGEKLEMYAQDMRLHNAQINPRPFDDGIVQRVQDFEKIVPEHLLSNFVFEHLLFKEFKVPNKVTFERHCEIYFWFRDIYAILDGKTTEEVKNIPAYDFNEHIKACRKLRDKIKKSHLDGDIIIK